MGIDFFNFYGVERKILAVFYPTERMFLGYLLMSALMAYIVYRKHGRSGDPQKINRTTGFFNYLLRQECYTHYSARQDYVIFVVTSVVYTGILAQFLFGGYWVSDSVVKMLNWFSPGGAVSNQSTGLLNLVYTVQNTLLFDFGLFVGHWLVHRVPCLWAFHKVHHSAEVLNPVTAARFHPVDLWVSGMVVTVFVSAGHGVMVYLAGSDVQLIRLFGINVFLFLFYLLGANLRHTHIWLEYPGWMSFILISPAQHQVHHSREHKYMNKNLGFMFSFWDRLFGTLYVPKGFERIAYGVSVDTPNPYASIYSVYGLPFLEALGAIEDRMRGLIYRKGK